MFKNPFKIGQKLSKIGLRRQMRLGRNKKTKNYQIPPPILDSILGSCWGPRRIKFACDFLMLFRTVFWAIFGRSWGHLVPQVGRFFDVFLLSTWDLMSKSFRHRLLIDFGGPWNLKILQKHVFCVFFEVSQGRSWQPSWGRFWRPRGFQNRSQEAPKSLQKRREKSMRFGWRFWVQLERNWTSKRAFLRSDFG